MTPDLQQNLMVTLYLIYSHNDLAIAYFCGMVLGVGLSIYRPSRFATMTLIGFALLLFQFEYDKHIVHGLRDQTMQSLITEQPHFRAQRYINLMISNIFPLSLFIGGWTMIFLAIFAAARKMGTHQQTEKKVD